jgi:hypothetical protein
MLSRLADGEALCSYGYNGEIMDQSLNIGRLMACQVDGSGENIRLSAEDTHGGLLHLHLTVEQIGALAMTLPHLLSTAIKARYRDETLRYVFPLMDFALENAAGSASAILSLKTPDGYAVSFAISPEMLAALAESCGNTETGEALLSRLQ